METKNNNRHSVRRGGSESSASSTKIGRSRNKFGMTNFHGFTLVELIVVITILVILGTIAFVNMRGFSASAQDSARIENLANLKKGLDIYRTKNGTYPMPEGPLNILASGSIIGYQGFAKDRMAGLVNLSAGGTKDPSDAGMYTTYSVNASQTKMQAMVFLEDGSIITAFVPPLERVARGIFPIAWASPASDYSQRYPTVLWDGLGILLDSSTGATKNQPVQELLSASFTGVDIVNTSSGYRAYFGNKTTDILEGTWLLLAQIKDTMVTGGSKSPWCDTYDIAVGNQVWSACNAGASVAWTGQTLTNCAGGASDCDASFRYTIGSYYQWGRNDDVTPQGTPTATLAITGTLAWGVGHSNFITNGTSPNDWIAAQNDNLWGGQGTASTAGTFTSQGSPSAIQGPCPADYHVPTQYEWWQTLSTLNPALANTGSFQNDTSVATTLKLPLSGSRNDSTAAYSSQGVYGFYWSASPNGTNGYSIGISSTQVYPLGFKHRALGAGVRCLKN